MKSAKTTNHFNRNLHFVRAMGLGYRVVTVGEFNRISLLDADGKLINTGHMEVKRADRGMYYIGSPANAHAFMINIDIYSDDHIDINVNRAINTVGAAIGELIGVEELQAALMDMTLEYFGIGAHQIIERSGTCVKARGYLAVEHFEIYQENVDKWIVCLNGRTIMFGNYVEGTTHSSINNDKVNTGLCRADVLSPQETSIRAAAMVIRVTRENAVTSKALEISHEALDGALSQDYFDMLTADINTFEVVDFDIDVGALAALDPATVYGVYPIYAPANDLPARVILRNKYAGDLVAFTTENWILVPRRALVVNGNARIRGYINALTLAFKRMGE